MVLLDHLDPRWLQAPPRIGAPGSRQRAALGYLHGNCGGCHNAEGPLAPLGLVLAHSAIPGRGGVVLNDVDLNNPHYSGYYGYANKYYGAAPSGAGSPDA